MTDTKDNKLCNKIHKQDKLKCAVGRYIVRRNKKRYILNIAKWTADGSWSSLW